MCCPSCILTIRHPLLLANFNLTCSIRLSWSWPHFPSARAEVAKAEPAEGPERAEAAVELAVLVEQARAEVEAERAAPEEPVAQAGRVEPVEQPARAARGEQARQVPAAAALRPAAIAEGIQATL